jgi:hypothetical protein
MADELSQRYGNLLEGSYDCVDRIVLNAYFRLCYSGGGFREWWRRLMRGSEEQLDNAHLMRMAGRFSRRVRGFARAHGIPVIDCRRGERKHEIAEEYLATHTVSRGLFLILVARAVAPVWDVQHWTSGSVHLIKKTPYVNHYSFHILDPDWGHITIKMAGHPPFGAQIILNGHEYVACQARKAHLAFTKEDNCFTHITNAARLATIADTLAGDRAIGQLSQLCDKWIYSTCLCFALDADDQERTGFHYTYSIYQVEYSRNLLFRLGGQMEDVFQRMVDRTRARLDVAQLRTLFGVYRRPRQTSRRTAGPRLAVVLETPQYDLTVFKLHFGNLTLKAYTKGERVLRFEAVVHNTRDLGCGRVVARFPKIVARLEDILERFLTTLDCVDVTFVSDETLDQLPLPSLVGRTHVGGVDINKPRIRSVLAAVLALAPSPTGFSVTQLMTKVRSMAGQPEREYTVRHAAYDLKKLRGKGLIAKIGSSRRYQVQPHSLRAIAALVILRQHVIAPILAGVRSPHLGRKPKTWTAADRHYEQLRIRMLPLFHELGIAA